MKQLNSFYKAFSTKPLMLLFFFTLLPNMASAQCPDNNHPHMIDLGLPSGTKWACCNVGAQKPEDYGGYFAWGETEEKDVYNWETYLYGLYDINNPEDYSNLVDIGNDIAGTQYDVAYVTFGSSWMMPNKTQMEELIESCMTEWTTENGVNGRKFIGPNGSSIFLPASGFKYFVHQDPNGGYYRTSSIYDYDPYGPSGAYMMYFNSERVSRGWRDRNDGQSVRPVVAGSSIPSGITIDATNFPDENFRNWVLEQDFGTDGILTDEEIVAVTTIDVYRKGIADLKGIEYFTALTGLDCFGNQLTSLDVSGCTALTWLDCGYNQLTSLDVSKNTALKVLNCYNNQLISLDVSKNTALWFLSCYNNQINETEMGNLVESLPANNGEFYVKLLNDANEQNVITTAQVAAAKAKGWTVYAYDENWNRVEYDGDKPQEIAPVEQGETIDIGTEIDANTDLDGNVVGDVYYCISSGDGSYDPEEGCIVVTKPTDDSAIDGKDIFGEDFKDGYTGFVFMVAPGKGTINVEAETTGNMVLKVKVGDNTPTQMEVNGKTKVSFSYDVSEPTMVFIYGSIAAAGAKGMMKASGTGALKIYGIEVTSTDGIEDIKDERLKMKDSPMYNLSGQRVISSPSGRPGGVPTKGVYIQNGKKVLVK